MRRILFSTWVAGVTALFLSAQVLAADWIVRSRLTFVAPDDSSSPKGLELDNNITLGLDITRFFTPNFAAEIILGTTTHEVILNGGSLGSVSLLPPTLIFQYHFSPNATFRPYAGLGINYTKFYAKTGPLLSSLDLDDSFGLGVQVGADWMLTNRASINFDVKYANIETEVTAGGVKIADLDVNPWVIGLGVGYRF